jgi:hypothetical protein
MKREVRKLFEKFARSNRMNTRGRRAYKRRFERDYLDTLAAVRRAIEPFEGRKITDGCRIDMLAALGAVGPSAPPRYTIKFVEPVERTINFTITLPQEEPADLTASTVA